MQGARGGTRTHTTVRSRNFKSLVATNYTTRAIKKYIKYFLFINYNTFLVNFQINLRPRAESNRRIKVLQTFALPLGD